MNSSISEQVRFLKHLSTYAIKLKLYLLFCIGTAFMKKNKSFEMENIVTIIFQIAWHFASSSRLKFSHDDHNKHNDWIFNLDEICISNKNQLLQWPITFSVSRARFVVNKTHTSFKKTAHKKKIWKCNVTYNNVTYNYYSNRILCQCLLFLVFYALFYCPRVL